MAIAIVGSLIATALMHWMQQRNYYPYTFPFIAVTWLALALLPQNNLNELIGVIENYDFAVQFGSIGAASDAILQGFGQVMFQANSLTGLLFILAIAINQSFKSLGFSLLAALIALALAFLLNWPQEQWQQGIFAYNAVLTAIALSTFAFYLVLVGVLLAIVLVQGMLLIGLPALTFPFVLSTWLVLVWRFFRTKSTSS